MAKERKWKSNAEKMRYYRARKKYEAEKAAKNSEGRDSEKALKSSQTTWNSKNNYSIIQKHIGFDFKKSMPYGYFLLENKKNKGNYLVVKRTKPSRQGYSSKHHEYTDLDKAKEAFNSLVSGKSTREWYTVDDYLEEAFDFMCKYNLDPSSTDKITKTTGLMIAMDEIHHHGYKGSKGVSTVTDRTAHAMKRVRRYVFNAIGDDEIPSVEHDAKILIEGYIKKIAAAEVTEDADVISEGTFWSQSRVIRDIVSLTKYYRHAFPQFIGFSEGITEIARNIQKAARFSPSKGTGTVRDKNNFNWMNLDVLSRLLGYVYERDLPSYYFMLLTLQTALRPAEVRRLADKKELYLLPSGELNYKGLGINDDELLITKTDARIDIRELNNVPLYPLSRLLLLNDYHIELADFVFKLSNKECPRHFISELSHHVERDMRITAGHHIAYCSKARVYRADHNDVKDRMGHGNVDMAYNVYAKHAPSSLLPERYFGIKGFSKKGDSTDYAEHQSLWDLWLQRDFMTRELGRLDKEKDKKSLWDNLRKEVEIFNLNMGGSDADVDKGEFD